MRLRSGHKLIDVKPAGRARKPAAGPSNRRGEMASPPHLGPSELGITKPTRKKRRKTHKPRCKFSDLPQDLLQTILGCPKGLTIRRRDVTKALKIRFGALTFRNLYTAYKNMYGNCPYIDLSIPSFMEMDSIPAEYRRFQYQICLLVKLVGPNLKILKIPQLEPVETRSVIIQISRASPEIHTIAFTDARSIPSSLAVAFLNKCRNLQTMEVSDPGHEFLTGFWKSRARIQNLSILRMQSNVVHRLSTLLTRKGRPIRRLAIGEQWETCMYNRSDTQLREFFQLPPEDQPLLKTCMRSLRQLTVYTPKSCCAALDDIGIDDSLLEALRKTMTVEYISNHESFHYAQFLPGDITRRFWERSLLLETVCRRAEGDADHVYGIAIRKKLPEILKVNCELWEFCYSAPERQALFHALYKIICPTIRSVLVLDCFGNPERCRHACKMLSFLRKRLTLIDTVYVSFEIVAYTNVCQDFIADMLNTFTNLKELHLLCQRKGHRFACYRVGYPRFVRNLSRFLSMLETHCPQLELITIESGRKYKTSQASLRSIGLLEKVIKRVETFEYVMPNVDASTLLSQLHYWLGECIIQAAELRKAAELREAEEVREAEELIEAEEPGEAE